MFENDNTFNDAMRNISRGGSRHATVDLKTPICKSSSELFKTLSKSVNLSTKDIDNNVKLKFLKKAVFSYGCNMHEHALYGACLDGLCGRRGQWEQTLILKRDMNRLEGLDNEYVRHKHIIYNICNYTYI